jgi:hypothetical protein
VHYYRTGTSTRLVPYQDRHQRQHKHCTPILRLAHCWFPVTFPVVAPLSLRPSSRRNISAHAHAHAHATLRRRRPAPAAAPFTHWFRFNSPRRARSCCPRICRDICPALRPQALRACAFSIPLLQHFLLQLQPPCDSQVFLDSTPTSASPGRGLRSPPALKPTVAVHNISLSRFEATDGLGRAPPQRVAVPEVSLQPCCCAAAVSRGSQLRSKRCAPQSGRQLRSARLDTVLQPQRCRIKDWPYSQAA